MAIPWQLLKTL